MTRQHKTPKQRAEEQLAVATRVADRLDKQLRKARADVAHLSNERDAAVLRRDYLTQHPDLQQQPTTTTQEKSTP